MWANQPEQAGGLPLSPHPQPKTTSRPLWAEA